MEKLLGILFCGGRGTRLGEISKYISKPLIPVYDKPVFKYGLNLLQQSALIDEIILLTNVDNNSSLINEGYQTIIQNDELVFDMFSGWKYIKTLTKTRKDAVLVPSDNIIDLNIDNLIYEYKKTGAEISFSLVEVKDKSKLREMGSYDVKKQKFYYKAKNPTSNLGVVAPYIVSNTLNILNGDQMLSNPKSFINRHEGYWFDIGDPDSTVRANEYFKKLLSDD